MIFAFLLTPQGSSRGHMTDVRTKMRLRNIHATEKEKKTKKKKKKKEEKETTRKRQEK